MSHYARVSAILGKTQGLMLLALGPIAAVVHSWAPVTGGSAGVLITAVLFHGFILPIMGHE